MSGNILADLLEKGVKLTYKRLLEEKSMRNGNIIICVDGKIIRLKAKDVLEDLKKKGEL